MKEKNTHTTQRQSYRPVNSTQAAYYQRIKRKKVRRKQKAILLLALVLILGILVIGFLLLIFSEKNKTKTAVIVPASSHAKAQATAKLALSLPSISLPPVANGPYDEAESPLLFNYNNPIPESYLNKLLSGSLVDVGNGQQMQEKAAKAYLDMSDAAKKQGINLVPISGFRTNQRQTGNYNNAINSYLQRGFSYEQAVQRTEGYYAIPGTSEHEAGLAIDIGAASAPNTNISDSFEETDAFAWLAENCNEYGFILRYFEADFKTTHIHYEPWHYRYVGANHAAAITKQAVCLEDYLS